MSPPAKRSRGAEPSGPMEDFGVSDGHPVKLITLTLGPSFRVRVSSFGATVTSIVVPDAYGAPTETVLGFDEHAPYEACPYFGCTVGRFANRIAKGAFDLDGRRVELPAKNDRGNHLHGGARGWDKRVWAVDSVSDTACSLTLDSPDGDEGYPGAVSARVTFRLEFPARLAIDYRATSTAPTPVNLTNHSYFNLTDGGRTDVLDHLIRVWAHKYLPTDPACIPTGELREVSGPMDLRQPVPIFRGIGSADGGNGYDHNYVLDDGPGRVDGRGMKHAAWLRSPRTGIEMDVLTTEPGIQVCAANHLDGSCTGRGNVYGPNSGVCLETQHYPDSVNQPAFPDTILRPGEVFESSTVYAFAASTAQRAA